MKKLWRWMLPAILAIYPALGMDPQDKAFLSHENAKYAIVPEHSYETEDNGTMKITALVSATLSSNEKMERHIPVTGFTPTGWDCNDAEKHCKRKGKIFIQFNRLRIEAPYTKAEEFPYTHLESHDGAIFVGTVRTESTDLVPGVKATEHAIERFKRSDNKEIQIKSPPKDIIAQVVFQEKAVDAKEFMEKNPVDTKAEVVKYTFENGAAKTKLEVLYQVVIKEKTEPPVPYQQCRKHGAEAQFSIKKFGKSEVRHAYDYYTAVPTTRLLNKMSHNGEEKAIYTGPREVLLTLLHQEDLGPGQKNQPQCTMYTGDKFPPGYRLAPKH
jgi:hypothetical protein